MKEGEEGREARRGGGRKERRKAKEGERNVKEGRKARGGGRGEGRKEENEGR